MKPHIDLSAMDDTTPTSKVKRLAQALGTAPAREDVVQSRLRIEYTATRVLPDAIGRVSRLHGVLTPERSELADSFKMLRSQLRLRLREDGHSVLAVTSARAMRGKSIAALNLALTMAADLDQTVLLVDADLSTAGLQHLFGLDGAGGLVDHLEDATPLQDVLINPGVDRLVLLPAGRRAPPNPSELLGTRAVQRLLKEMKQRYADRTIIVDLPPLLETADTLAFLPLVDTTLLVVEDHSTTTPDLEQVAELMAPFNLIGRVVCKASPDDEERKAWAGPRRWFGRRAR
jgi:protein-tyrosine kinase